MRSTVERKLECFVGRDWFIQQLRSICDSDEHKQRTLFIVGAPGVGKSAIASRLIAGGYPGFAAHWTLKPAIPVIAFHICMADHEETLMPETFVRSIASQLCLTVLGFT